MLKEAHESKFVVHPGNTKMYRDLKEFYWSSNIKKRSGWVYGQVCCMSISEGRTLKVDKAFTTTFDNWMEVGRYHNGFCIKSA